MPDLNLAVQDYPKPEEVSNLSFALAEPHIKIHTEMSSTATSGLIDRIKQDTKDVACYLNDEINKILLSKGFTITSHFQSYNHMTFTQKRNTSALFYPEIIISIEESSMRTGARIAGLMRIDATVNIVMMEPLSGEKLWVKSLPIEEMDEQVRYSFGQYGGQRLDGHYVPKNLKAIAAKVDRLFEEISAEVIDATEKYVERQEFECLNEDIKRLKGIKRY